MRNPKIAVWGLLLSLVTTFTALAEATPPIRDLSIAPPSSQSGRTAPPADAEDLKSRMSEIIDFVDSRTYASSVSWQEHIVLCFQLARGVDPTLLEFSVINGSATDLHLDRHEVLAIAIAGEKEEPTWVQVRKFLDQRSVLDFQSSPSTLQSAQILASASRAEILAALEAEEQKELSDNGPLPDPAAPSAPEALPGTAYNTYFGFLHAHSDLSDGEGSPEEAYSYARDVAGLDFFALTDHGEDMIDWPWQADKYDRLLHAADAHDAPGSFAALYGFEWSHYFLGHINVINVRSATNVFSRLTLNSVYRWIADKPYSIARFNHPGRQDDTGEEFSHFRYEPSVANNMVGLEVWNKGHDFEEQFYLCSWSSCQAPTFMDEAIRKGWRLGPLGGGDNHHRQWGTNTDFRVAVLSTQLTRNDIINAYFDRRFYATEDKNLLLDVRVQGHPMGSRLTNAVRELRVEATDSAADPFVDVRLYRDGHLIDSRAVSGNSVAVTFNDPNSSGSNYYYVVVRQADGEEAVSSPIYISGPAPATPPVACLTNSCNGFSCDFDATCTTGGNGGITSYAWNFGDGSSATGTNASHSFAGTGTYTVQLTVTDALGQTNTASRQVSVSCGDTASPTVLLTAPLTGQFISGTTMFSANASDNMGVTKVKFLVGDQVVCTDNVNDPPWSCQANVDSYPTGEYPVKAVAFDACGNSRTSAPRTVRLVSNPEMAVEQPAANATVSGTAVAISGWAIDPDRVTSLTITLDGAVTIPVTRGTSRPDVCQAVQVNDPNCNNVGFSGAFDSTLYANGPHRIVAVATDATGKQTTRTINVTVANTPPATCTPGPYTLCLRDNRFKVEASYVSNGNGQAARAKPYSDETGFFWFFGSANLEIGVKVLGPVDGHWWVFHGPGTDREYTLTVTDTVSGQVQPFVKPAGSLCGASDVQSFPASASGFGGDETESESFAIETFAGGCTPSSTRLCLQNDRFQVEVLRSGVAQPAIELTPETGTVWFFNAANAEVFVKVLDGRGINQHYWVFYGSLTDRDYTVRVVDTLTGREVSYDNDLGNNCGKGDAIAFPNTP
jgi:PKD repeat protein